MSNNPSDPFQGQSSQPGQTSNGYAQQGPPAKSSKVWLWVLGILGLGGLLCVVCCGAFAYFGYSMAGNAIVLPYVNNPVFVEQIGELESSSISTQGTAEYQSENPGSSHLILEVTGSKGSGRLAILPNQPGSAILIMPDGTTYDLESSQPDFNNLEIDMGEEDLGGFDIEFNQDESPQPAQAE